VDKDTPLPGTQSRVRGGFSQIENSFLRDKRLSPEARWLGTMIASYANRERVAWPGVKVLCGLTGLGVKRLKAARRELVKCGALVLAQSREGGQFRRVQYEIRGAILHTREENPAKRS
jgi:hypothetical protein